MQGTVESRRRGIRNFNPLQYIIKINDDKVVNKETAAKYLGKKVIYTTIGNKSIIGKVIALHGNKGKIRAFFDKSLPGSVVGEKVEIK